MRKKIQTYLMTMGMVIFLCSMSLPQEGDIYWYVNGQEYYWSYQPDVFAFRCKDEKAFAGKFDEQCVAYHFHRTKERDKMNILYFKKNCSMSAREQVKEAIRQDAQFQQEFPVITLFPNEPYSTGAWFLVDDLLLVNFNPDSLSLTSFNEFKQKYGLRQINFPDSVFMTGLSTYIFDFNEKNFNAIELSKMIYVDENTRVRNVQPNLINAYRDAAEDEGLVSSEATGDFVKKGVEFTLMHVQNKVVRVYAKFENSKQQTLIKVYDVFGRETYSYMATGAKIQHDIPVHDYAGGIYFACIENERGEVYGVQKFLKL